MKVAQRANRVKIQGDSIEYSFKIKESAKAFKVLTSNLYSDPVSAVIRELSTNAADSHVEAGCPDKPFDVFVPTSVKPVFFIRDYGTGLSLQEMHSVFIVLFESTRENSNDHTGCLGLGSKSPFSYTDSFLVESWKDGEHNICMMYLDEDGLYKMRAITDTDADSNQPNGVKVSINIKTGDVYDWHSKASRIYTHFKTQPNFIGAKVHVNVPEYIMHGDGWRLRKDNTYNNNCAHAVMGNIAYPIKVYSSSIPHNINGLLNSRLDVDFNIGELEIEPSREGLHFDNRTITNIVSKFEKILKELSTKITAFFDECDSLWDARCLLAKLNESIPAAIISKLPTDVFKWNGKVISRDWNRCEINTLMEGSDLFKFERQHYGRTSCRRTKSHSLQANDKVRFVENDMKIGSQVRVRELINNNKDIDEVILISFDDDAIREAWMEKVGILDKHIVLASSLPKPPKVVRTRTSNGVKIEAVSKFVGGSYVSRAWENQDKDLEDGGYYVELSRFQVKDENGEKVDNGVLKSIINALSHLMDEEIEVWGVKTSSLDKVTEELGWKNFFVYAKEQFDILVQEESYSSNLGLIKENRSFLDNVSVFANDVAIKLIEIASPGTYLQELHKDYKSTILKDSEKKDIESIQSLCACLSKPEIKPEPSKLKLAERWKKVEKAVPLLDALPYHHYLSTKEALSLSNYIHFCLENENE